MLLPEVLKLMTESDRVRHRELETELRKFDAQKPRPLPVALALTDRPGSPPKTHLLERGELRNAGAEVEPGYLRILLSDQSAKPAPVQPPRPATTGRRTALADWITSKENSLTARVLVNRLWQHHFARGIVPTASDFGTRGEPPTHPELLDWLATQFVQSGWRIKPMHKLMLTSATYQQSSLPTAAAKDKDPNNRWFSHMNRQRLEGEIIRDNLLAVSGRLNRQLGGPGVFPLVPAEAHRDPKEWPVSLNPRDHLRRSIYIFARRNLRFPFLEAFDLPDSNLSCPKRERSTTAPQALALLNATDVVEAAKALAVRLKKVAASSEQRVELAYRLVLGRWPTATEVDAALDFLDQAPLSELCRALFNLNEFVYLD